MQPDLRQRLEVILGWYGGMVDARTGRLVYTYDPVHDRVDSGSSPIREIAAVRDVGMLGRFLHRSDHDTLIRRSLSHYTAMLVARGAALTLASDRLGEPASIAHSAFLALAMLASPARFDSTIRALIDGIVDQQRADGSFAIHFGDEPDIGIELYPAEAMLAILAARALDWDERYQQSVERAFDYYRTRIVGSDHVVFHANWQAQYGVLLHELSPHHAAAVRAHVFALHDRIIERGFYERVLDRPDRQATVEVACALEGICDAYVIAVREHDRRADTYAACARIALGYLARAQRLDHPTRERGGFGHTLADRTQRIDVTGHAMAGFIKALRAGLAE
jgi:hypothetical protein